MLNVFKTYMEISLMLTNLATFSVYAVGLVQFLTPFTQSKATKWGVGAAYAATMTVLYFLPYDLDNLAAYGAGVIVSFAFFSLLDRGNYPQKLFLAFSFFSLRWIAAAISNTVWVRFGEAALGFFVDTFLFDEMKLIPIFTVFYTIRICFFAAVMYFMIKIFHKVYVSKDGKMSIREALLLILPSISGVFNYRILLYFNSIDTQEAFIKPYNWVSFVFCIVSYGVLIVVIYFYEQIKAAQRKEKELAMLSVQTDNIRDYISGAESLYRDIRAIRHDMKNHLSVLARLSDKGEKAAFDSYLAEVQEHIGGDSGIVSGDPVTDVILTEKQSEAVKRGIEFNCDFHYPEGFSSGALDMSIILNNALNNAIEAAEICPENNRKISIGSYKKNKAFTITVMNTCIGNVELSESGIPHTTKSDSENHGFGLLNIKNTAEKYGGGIDIESKDGEFTLTVLLIIK
ncbi:MAG: GHKL domain-containing protein [Ruminiclostridium sp.]|nr:GHKL domain-containing protein [Ruminiclostridium sp.]